MSSRGWFVTNPDSERQVCLSESANRIPLLWLSFLAPVDLDNAENAGEFWVDRKQAVGRSAACLPFLASLFPEVHAFQGVAEEFIQKVRAKRCKTIGIEVTELIDEEPDPAMPGLHTAVDVIERGDANYEISVPARKVFCPVTRTTSRRVERAFRTSREMVCYVCGIDADSDLLESKTSPEHVRETIVGYVWK